MESQFQLAKLGCNSHLSIQYASQEFSCSYFYNLPKNRFAEMRNKLDIEVLVDWYRVFDHGQITSRYNLLKRQADKLYACKVHYNIISARLSSVSNLMRSYVDCYFGNAQNSTWCLPFYRRSLFNSVSCLVWRSCGINFISSSLGFLSEARTPAWKADHRSAPSLMQLISMSDNDQLR